MGAFAQLLCCLSGAAAKAVGAGADAAPPGAAAEGAPD